MKLVLVQKDMQLKPFVARKSCRCCVYKAKTAMPAARTRPPKLAAMLEAEPVEGSTLVRLPPVGLATPVEKDEGAEWTAVALLGMV